MPASGNVCLVTGGANGIGRCITETFLSQGRRVALVDRDAEAGHALAGRFPGRLLFVHGDIAEDHVLKAFVTSSVDAFGRVDVLVNNACVSRGGLPSGCGYADFNYVLRVGVTAPYFLACLLTGHFAPGASIVNIGSTRARMSQPDTESYTAAKGGLAALTHALSVSLAGIARVNSISPGWIDTSAWQRDGSAAPSHSAADRAQHPSGRIGMPDDIARTVLFLCSAEATFINGQDIVVDGGISRQMIYHGGHGWTYTPPPAG